MTTPIAPLVITDVCVADFFNDIDRVLLPYLPMVEDEVERKRRQECTRLVQFRRKKKTQLGQLNEERRRLEMQMKFYENLVRQEASTSGPSQCGNHPLQELRKLIVEKDVLSTQNVALREELHRHTTLHNLLKAYQDEVVASSYTDVNVLSKNDGLGWWVELLGGESSFYYQSLSKTQLDEFKDPFQPGFDSDSPSSIFYGNFAGWDVYRAPKSPENPRFVRIRSTKRVQCSIDALYQSSITKQKDYLPLLVAPIGWGFRQHGKVTTQVLQTFHGGERLMLHNIPGPTSFRYLMIVQRAQWELRDGRRKMAFSMVMIDPKITSSTSTEDRQNNVEWMTDGGNYLTLTEVSEHTTDVVHEQWATSQSELHAEYLKIHWTNTSVRWEQGIVPSNHLKF